MAKSLLQKAKAIPARKSKDNFASKQEIELALAWVKGEVTLAQASIGFDCKSTNAVYTKLLFVLKHFILETMK